MASVVNSVMIAGPLEPVFDLATTARLWLRWHPATRQVGGTTERPYLLGDLVREQGVAIGIPFDTVWTISQHQRPRAMTMTSPETGTTITYEFSAAPDGVELVRTVEFDAEQVAKHVPSVDGFAQLMSAESATALAGLKAVVEELLEKEKATT